MSASGGAGGVEVPGGANEAADEAVSECEIWGHDDAITYQDAETENRECTRCGAEWWQDKGDDE